MSDAAINKKRAKDTSHKAKPALNLRLKAKPGFVVSALFWLLGSVIGLLMIANDIGRVHGILIEQQGVALGRDFINVWSGGKLTLSGELERLYDYPAYVRWQMDRLGLTAAHNYSYPPHTLFIALPFGFLPYLPALMLWTLAGAIFFVWAASPYLRDNFPAPLAALTPAGIINIWNGHYGFFIGGLWLLCFACLERQRVKAGIFAGLLTIKPHLGLLLPFVLLIRRQWTTIWVAVAATLSLILASGFIFGFGLWRDWLVDMSAVQIGILRNSRELFYFHLMPTTLVALRGAPEWFAWTAQLAASTTALFLLWQARHAAYTDLAFIAATATVIFLPYAFNYDMTVACLGFALLLYSRWSELNRGEVVILALAFAVPQLVIVANWLAPPILLLALWIQVRHAIGAKAFPMSCRAGHIGSQS